MRRTSLVGMVGGAAVLLAPAAVAAPRVALQGGMPARTEVCGAAASVREIALGSTASAVVAAAKSGKGRTEREGSTIVVERCDAGAWKVLKRVRPGSRAKTLTVALPAEHDADLRIRSRTRTGASGPARMVRVGAGEIVNTPVSFQVVNRNGTSIPCLNAPDGKTYTVRGTITGPRSELGKAATLYLHGLGYSGSLFWRFDAVPGYDYAREQASAGHVSVVIDRLGNPANGQLSDGNATCFGSQADIAAQIVGQLRKGAYDGAPGGFAKVLLAGHSAGGFITQVAQASFKAADAIAVISFADVAAPLTLQQFIDAGGQCLTAPKTANGDGTGAPNYATFGGDDAGFKAAHIHNMDPEVEKVLLAKNSNDPCGDLLNAAQYLVADQLFTRTVTAPVLIIGGANDALFPPPTNQMQRIAYPSSKRVSLVEIPNTGHAITLGRTHEQFRKAMDGWLKENGA